MRTFLFSIIVIFLGIAAGVCLGHYRLKPAPWQPPNQHPQKNEPPPSTAEAAPAPKVVVEQPVYDFGKLDVSAGGSHDFVLRNVGEGPLKLTLGGSTCRCTVGKLQHEEVPPGGTTKVTVNFRPAEQPGPYLQTVTLLTNDPHQPRVELKVTGTFVAALQFSPSELVFSNISAGEPAIGQVQLVCYLDEPVEIKGYYFSGQTTAEYFEVAWEPLKAEELKPFADARSGLRITVKVKAGLPPGPLQQILYFHTNLAAAPKVPLLIEGNISGEIALVGPGWDAERGVLNLGTVSSRVGLERRLWLVVRGPSRKEIAVKLARVSPRAMEISFGDRQEINQGAVIQIPLLLRIPPGSPTVNRLGSEQGGLGEIVLETNHPQIPVFRILVRLAIED